MNVVVDGWDEARVELVRAGIDEALHRALGSYVARVVAVQISLSLTVYGCQCRVRLEFLNEDRIEVLGTGVSDEDAVRFGLSRARAGIARRMDVARILGTKH